MLISKKSWRQFGRELQQQQFGSVAIIIFGMIKASLKYHTPEFVYEYFQNNIGSVSMLIKNGYAIINFKSPEHAQIALDHKGKYMINGFNLEISKFVEGQLDTPQTVYQPALEQQQPSQNPFQNHMNDASSSCEGHNVINKFCQDLYHFLKDYREVLKTAVSNRYRQIEEGYIDQETIRNEQNIFQKRLNREFAKITADLKNKVKQFNSSIKHFSKKEPVQIDLNPVFQAMDIEKDQSKKFQNNSFERTIDFINIDAQEIKRIRFLNEKQFIFTELKKDKGGKVKIYGVDDENSLGEVNIPAGPYGLLILGENVLVGNREGKVNTMHVSNLDEVEESIQLHKGNIFDLHKLTDCPAPIILTVGMDQSVKSWHVREEEINEGVNILQFSFAGLDLRFDQQIASVEVFAEKNIYAGSFCNIFKNDCESITRETCLTTRFRVTKLKRFNQNILLVGNELLISLMDLRTNIIVQDFELKQEVKSLCTLSENSIFYGSEKEVGVMDVRNGVKAVWRDQSIHKSMVYDVACMNDLVVTGDRNGVVAGWKCLD